ncbi:MAG TPA: GTP-binding protein HSR1 [Firmicutes bacterium]|nr:GTP-binding protein HSR1 [Bacillota bacterium]
MRRCIVLGKPNAGKTLFVLHFAEFLHAKEVTIKFQEPVAAPRKGTGVDPEARTGSAACSLDPVSGSDPGAHGRNPGAGFGPSTSEHFKTYKIQDAVRDLTGPRPHTTRCLQSVVLELPAGKGKKTVELIDTSGLTDGIHQDAEIRRAMSQTLSSVRAAHIILHIIDASKAGKKGAVEAMGDVDYQVAAFAQMRGGYCILANKIDLPGARDGVKKIRDEFPGHIVIPISALYKEGFKEVKAFVLREL